MKNFLIVVILLFSSILNAQTKFFYGSVDFGSGISTIIDNSKYNNGAALGLMGGFSVGRKITPNTSLELGFNYSLYGNSYIFRFCYQCKSHIFTRLNYIELPFLVIFRKNTQTNKNFSYIAGYSSAILLGPNQIKSTHGSETSKTITEFYDLKKYTPLIYAGLQWENLKFIHHSNFRVRTLFSFSPISIMTSEGVRIAESFNEQFLVGTNPKILRLIISVGYILD